MDRRAQEPHCQKWRSCERRSCHRDGCLVYQPSEPPWKWPLLVGGPMVVIALLVQLWK